MENIKKRYTITSALPYANGPIHIGHLAGVYIPADIFARYLRANKTDVLFIGGSDEHGVPITIKARKEGLTPQDIVDRYHNIIKKSFEDFGITFDIYSRTSNDLHHKTASEFFTYLFDKNAFIEKTTSQFFDTEANQFLADRYITGTCPHCNNEKAYGDQCENCGTSLNATDLINPKSTLSGNPPILKETTHWFLPLDKYEPWLRQWILEEHKEWKPNVYGQCKSWIDQGLQARAVTRDLDWGVKVPIKEAEGKVLYVWFDAPIGYITATKEYFIEKGEATKWELYWKQQANKEDNAHLIHFIGKDNIVFHCIVFPTMLKAHEDYILPENVPANEFLNLEGDKISTSRNWAVWLHEYLEEFPNKQDVLRYTLCTNAPETKDNDFTWKDFQAKNNNELVAILGNFVNRALVLTHKYYQGKVPQQNILNDADKSVLEELSKFPARIGKSIETYRFREAINEMINLARLGNKYLADSEPWKIYATHPERVSTILNISLQIVANLAIVAEPFLPFTADKINKILNIEKSLWDKAGSIILEGNHQINAPSLLFDKIEDDVIAKQIERLKKAKEENIIAEYKPITAKDNIEFDLFGKIDLRIATIIDAEKVAKTKKLLKLTLNTGVDKRTVVSGIAEYYSPEEIIGKQIIILLNLQPKDLKGIQSNGMILMAEDKNGKLVLVSPVEKVTEGSPVK
ncbi:MAG: methionine--tRNA ligase [Bacteroidetes bacterium GWE2_29_8]|nr:MAG: methionine--tRNA ligase [Bacteroidetes bacterium GWE2_29_8]